jgi:sulfur carrier protein
MRVTVDVLGGECLELEVQEGSYADILAAIDLSPNEASVLVDGRPVPADQPIDESEVQVLRMVKGG